MSRQLEVLAFPEYRIQALRLADALGCRCRDVEVHRFPDGESRVRVPADPAPQSVLCRSLHGPNDKLIELMLAAQTLRAAGCDDLTLVAPYLCYMRQDTAFRPGEAVSQRIVGEFLAHQVDSVITVDPHLHRAHRLAQAVPARRAVALSAAEPIAAFLAARQKTPLLVGPDSESEQWVRHIAEAAGLTHAVAAKRRSGDRAVHIDLPPGDYRGREVVLVDDMASTGGTLACAARELQRAGAAPIHALVTHALLAGDAEAHLRAAPVAELWSTDSVPHSTNAIPLAPLLAAAVQAD
ncbi:MAG: ribose-phosphate diphosphokinase [Gammaproteobacteria bacterium]|nr:ribose-phosphate diphosphokinase [Gammaproteobacteria bacterium]NIR97803.1 ribose-phosphate diphosphokinase [Gammaproteobacteria bacterium]NIT63503.1 ribose-phosphate diphosphokinase [Gammaproteobacteria bacterium]NIV20450.1 ribose-phosphate diphosphokinase [Gammaproteobacteria bacterium]NIX11032.1 ribose-phosphate diphosphokinase [Gammaproteobacteria bacterium]